MPLPRKGTETRRVRGSVIEDSPFTPLPRKGTETPRNTSSAQSCPGLSRHYPARGRKRVNLVYVDNELIATLSRHYPARGRKREVTERRRRRHIYPLLSRHYPARGRKPLDS